VSSSRIARHVNAPRAAVDRALLDARATAITSTLADALGGATALHDRLPPGVARADNELGRRLSLAKVAELGERGEDGPCAGQPT
jgi:L-alanine-DL-glutamate epimerase-like enolase superfamily enzyme